MSARAVTPDFGILQQIFAEVANEAAADPIEHLLVMTYEFDDQQLANLLSGKLLADNTELRRNQLKFIADMQPVVIYDTRKTREFNQLPHFLDLLPVKAKAYSCHHAKAYLLVTRDTVRLVLGSFNLTRTGLFENREVYAEFCWSARQSADLGLLAEFGKLVRHGYTLAQASRHAIADKLDARVSAWTSSEKTAESATSRVLLYSGYDLPDSTRGAGGLETLAELWRAMSPVAPRKVFAVSPFFDGGGDKLFFDHLAQTLGEPEALQLVTDELNIIKLSKRHFGALDSGRARTLNLIPSELGQAERQRIAKANEITNVEDLQISRSLHAKILVLCSGKQHLIYLGSANFTRKAWLGDNTELGVVTRGDGSADKLIALIVASLGASSDNAYPRLKDFPDGGEQDEDEINATQAHYPEFLDKVVLEADLSADTLVFHFGTEYSARLQDYEITWGAKRLLIEGDRSRPLALRETGIQLQGGRNLRFVFRAAPEHAYLIPFTHDAELTRQQDLLLFSSTEDWMQYCLYPESISAGSEDECLPGQEASRPVQDQLAERDGNVVVSMQRFLNLFGRLEAEFDARTKSIAALAEDNLKLREWERRIGAPLRVFAGLLKQDRRKNHAAVVEQVYQFQLGELLLLCRSLAKSHGCFAASFDALAKSLALELHGSAAGGLGVYLEFVRTEVADV